MFLLWLMKDCTAERANAWDGLLRAASIAEGLLDVGRELCLSLSIVNLWFWGSTDSVLIDGTSIAGGLKEGEILFWLSLSENR